MALQGGQYGYEAAGTNKPFLKRAAAGFAKQKAKSRTIYRYYYNTYYTKNYKGISNERKCLFALDPFSLSWAISRWWAH